MFEVTAAENDAVWSFGQAPAGATQQSLRILELNPVFYAENSLLCRKNSWPAARFRVNLSFQLELILSDLSNHSQQSSSTTYKWFLDRYLRAQVNCPDVAQIIVIPCARTLLTCSLHFGLLENSLGSVAQKRETQSCVLTVFFTHTSRQVPPESVSLQHNNPILGTS